LVQQISALIVQPVLDPSKYSPGAQEKVAADKAMVTSAREAGAAQQGLSVVLTDTSAKITTAGDVVTRLERTYVAGAKQALMFERDLSALNRAIETGKTDIADAANILVGMNQKLGLSADASSIAASGQSKLAAAVTLANDRIRQQTTLLNDVAIAEARAAQMAENQRQAAAANQGRFNQILGVGGPVVSAPASASVFQAEFDRLDVIAARKAQQIGQNFAADLDASLSTGISKVARDSAAIFQAEFARIDEIASLKAQQAGAIFQSDLNASFGIGTSGKSANASASVFEQAARESEMYEQKARDLRAALGDVSIMQDRLNAELAEYAVLAERGLITSEQFAKAQAMARARSAGGPSPGLARAAGFNAGQQLQDIAMMSMLGQSPMTLALQQGPQLASAIEMGGGLAALRAGLVSLVSPTTLLTVGLTAATAAAIQYFSKAKDSAQDLNKVLSRQKEILQSLGPAYQELARAQSGPFESTAVARLSLQANLEDARKALKDQAGSALREAQGAGGTFLGLLGALPEGTQRLLGRSPASIEFDRIVDAASKGKMSINDARAALAHFGQEHPDFGYVIGRFISMTNTAAETERQVKSLEGTLNRLGNPDRASVGGPAALDRAQRTGRDSAIMRQRFGDDPFANMREEQRQKEKTLAEAQKDRARALDQAVDSQRLELALIGKTTGEAARMRFEFERIQALREDAARNGVAVDEKELALIRAKAAEYAKYADAIARANLGRDLAFERSQMGLSTPDQAVASRLQSAGLSVDLDSQAAKEIRINEILKQRVGIWNDIRDTGMDAIDQLVSSASRGFDDIGDVVEGIASDITKQILQLSVANPLKNAIYGAGLPTLDDAGGIGGFLGTLLGKTPNPAAGFQSVGAMTVNAGSVVVTGSIGVNGGAAVLDRLFPAENANGANLPISGMSSYAAAIRSIESAGNGGYSALGPLLKNGDQALGAYGIMRSNLPSWSMAALGRNVSQSEFMGSSSIQDAIFQNRFGSYLSKYGNAQDAASTWFTGRPLASGKNAVDILGTSGAAYVEKFNRALGGTTSGVMDFGKGLRDGLGQFGDGLGDLWGKLGTFLQSPLGGGSSWFQGLSSMFGGISGAMNHMLSISPAATGDILSGVWGAFDRGGYTGDGGKYQVAGLAHRGEFYFSKEATANLGVDYLSSLHEVGRRGRGFAGGGFAGGAVPSGWRTSGASSQSNGIKVVVNNYGEPTDASVQQSTDADGSTVIEVMMEKKIRDEVTRPSAATNRQLRGTYGLTNQVVRR